MKRTPVVMLGTALIVLLVSLSGCFPGPNASPAIGIAASPTGGPASLEVAFTGDILVGNSANTWVWDFGDGSDVRAGLVVTHIYEYAGTFTATLTAIVDGRPCTQTQTIEVTKPEPAECSTKILDIDYWTSGDCCMYYTFEPAFSGPTPIAYEWKFGDGKESTLANPTNRYLISGVTHRVTLRVMGKNGVWSDEYLINVPINGCCQNVCDTCPGLPTYSDCSEPNDDCSHCPLKPYEKKIIEIDLDCNGCGSAYSSCGGYNNCYPCGYYVTWHVYHGYYPADEENYDLEILDDGQCRRNKAEVSFYKVGKWKVIAILRDASGEEIYQTSQEYGVANY